jgi:hypothetical protein
VTKKATGRVHTVAWVKKLKNSRIYRYTPGRQIHSRSVGKDLELKITSNHELPPLIEISALKFIIAPYGGQGN